MVEWNPERGAVETLGVCAGTRTPGPRGFGAAAPVGGATTVPTPINPTINNAANRFTGAPVPLRRGCGATTYLGVSSRLHVTGLDACREPSWPTMRRAVGAPKEGTDGRLPLADAAATARAGWGTMGAAGGHARGRTRVRQIRAAGPAERREPSRSAWCRARRRLLGKRRFAGSLPGPSHRST